MMRIKNFRSLFVWLFFIFSAFIFSLGISWQFNKVSNFFYGFWYQTLAIEKVIVKNVAINTQGKRDFPSDDFGLHQRMFSEIVQAIHKDGQALSSINYQNISGDNKPLLTVSEVVHLQDVANLLTKVSYVWWANVLLFLLLLDFYCQGYVTRRLFNDKLRSYRYIPALKDKVVFVLCVVAVVTISFSLWGFTDIFYYLHTVVFPEGHQWFFYYRDSLMSTLMKAPDIFLGIGVQLVSLAVFLTVISEFLMVRYLRNRVFDK